MTQMAEVVDWIERSEIRGRIETGSPDFAALYPGYIIGRRVFAQEDARQELSFCLLKMVPRRRLFGPLGLTPSGAAGKAGVLRGSRRLSND
jgi:hypothetical protein